MAPQHRRRPQLPLPEEIERPACMVGRRKPAVQRRVRQLAPRPELLGCCDYHGQDWALASETAIRLLNQTKAESIEGEPAADRVMELAAAEGITILVRLVLLDPVTGQPA